MKIIFLFILFFNFINMQEEGEIDVKITNIISKDVAFGGYLFLETDGITIPSTSLNQENIFDLSIINDEDKNIYSLMCFFYKFNEDFYKGTANIACYISQQKSMKPGKYHLYPLINKMSFLFFEIYIANILPFNFSESFNIIDATEFYFYSLKKNELSFYYDTSSKTVKFDLFENSIKDIEIYLEETPISCQTSVYRMNCIISAKELPQDKRYQSLNVYIKDSKGNKKKNYFIYPIDIILNYIQKQTLKIKVSKSLNNCLTKYDFIALETSDTTLGNVIYSKQGFYLKVKNEDSNKVSNLFCNFHKHPGENTKIFCEVEDDLEDGFYSFEEYLSEGPLEDEDDRISPYYNIVIPSFKLNSRFIYSSNYGFDERIYDAQFREKIFLNYKNEGEILNITLNQENYEGKNEYFLGKNKLECFDIGNNIMSCEVPANNFEKSGIYYFENINLLKERERLFMIPPFEVSFSWDL